jgi:uncharacterized protein YktA (UPF0223 family)
MNVYTVLKKNGDDNTIEDIEYVSDGFYIWAFIFGPFYLFYKGLWRLLFWYLLIIILLGQLVISEAVTDDISSIIMFFISIGLAYLTEGAIVKSYLKKGYKIDNVVVASNYEEAELKHVTIKMMENEDTRKIY